MIGIVQVLIVGAGASGLTLLGQRILAKRAAPETPGDEGDPALVERWNPETVRFAYEHARELEQTIDKWADQIDSKAATIYGVAASWQDWPRT